MPSLKLLFVLATICVLSFSLPASDVTTESTPSSVHPVSARAASICKLPFDPTGYYWCTDSSSAVFNGLGGRYSIQWSGDGWFMGGRVWYPGSTTRVINYTGSYQTTTNSDLSVYGWTRNPLIEYYIVESYGSYNPSSAAVRKGTVTCDGASYDILQTTRVNQPSIDGTQTFQQFWSVRNPKKTPSASLNGTVTISCHFNAWKLYGMNLGSTHDFQLFAVEGSGGSGSATITAA